MSVDIEVAGVGAGSAPASVTLRGATMDEAVSVGGQVFHRHTLKPLDRAALPRLTLSSYRSGPVTMGALQYSAGARVQADCVPEAYQVNLVLSGTLRTGRGEQQLLATPMRAAQYGLHAHSFEGFETPTRILGVKIDRPALERRLETLLGRDLGGAHIEFGLEFPLDTAVARDWVTVVQMLSRRLSGPAGLSGDSLVLANLQDALLTGLLVASPHSFSDELAQPTGTAASRAIRLAIAYVDASADASLVSVPDLAAVAGVSVRALQAGFRKALDTTPLAFLHERRLTHARRELEHATPDSSSVARIADRWGFAHHGRFANDYRKRFGETPSATLRRI